MPITLTNLSDNLKQTLAKDIIIVQSPGAILPKKFANIYLFRQFKILKVVATVVNTSTTSTSFSVTIPTTTITVEIVAGHNNSKIWQGKEIIPAGSNIIFDSRAEGSGSDLTMVIEGEFF